ncbi:unnamed protein product [Ascophyllum nodosum]
MNFRSDDCSRPSSTVKGTLATKIGRTAAACLAATIVSSSVPMDAGAIAGLLPSSNCLDWSGAQTMLVLAEEDSLTATGGVGIPALVPELKKADSSESLLSTMIKINDAVDADEEGLLENTIERESVVNGLFERRRAGGEAWNQETEAVFGILKRKLDPFNVVLLRPYLKIAPFLGGLYYLGVFFVQQNFRALFPLAYFGAVAVFIAPAAILLLFN